MSLITFFTDHSSPVGAKKALLASAFFTIALSLVEVEGKGLTILGLTFVTKAEGMLNVSKLVLTYLILVYLSFLISDLFGWLKRKGLERNIKREEHQKSQAKWRFDNIVGEPDPEPYYPQHPGEELDEDFERAKRARSIADQKVETTHKFWTEAVTYFFQILLALVIALYALFAPKELTRSFLLSEKNSESEVVASEVASDPGPSSGSPEVEGRPKADTE